MTFEYLRHLGPRCMHGGVTIRFDVLEPYSFTSVATWPDDDNYDQYVREAVEQVLLERRGDLTKVGVVLVAISWDQVNSTPQGFRNAARAAANAAFDVP